MWAPDAVAWQSRPASDAHLPVPDMGVTVGARSTTRRNPGRFGGRGGGRRGLNRKILDFAYCLAHGRTAKSTSSTSGQRVKRGLPRQPTGAGKSTCQELPLESSARDQKSLGFASCEVRSRKPHNALLLPSRCAGIADLPTGSREADRPYRHGDCLPAGSHGGRPE